MPQYAPCDTPRSRWGRSTASMSGIYECLNGRQRWAIAWSWGVSAITLSKRKMGRAPVFSQAERLAISVRCELSTRSSCRKVSRRSVTTYSSTPQTSS